MNNLRADLKKFQAKHKGWLPGMLEYLIDQPWTDDAFLEDEFQNALASLERLSKYVPECKDDIAGLTEQETSFRSTFGHLLCLDLRSE
jgi:predicted molibdopterin-dependent oxidoreductase YjgC